MVGGEHPHSSSLGLNQAFHKEGCQATKQANRETH